MGEGNLTKPFFRCVALSCLHTGPLSEKACQFPGLSRAWADGGLPRRPRAYQLSASQGPLGSEGSLLSSQWHPGEQVNPGGEGKSLGSHPSLATVVTCGYGLAVYALGNFGDPGPLRLGIRLRVTQPGSGLGVWSPGQERWPFQKGAQAKAVM